MRRFGPSNFEKRPQEARDRIYRRESFPGLNDGEMVKVIWDARALMREQVKEALERNERGPDAMWGLAEEIRDSMGKIHQKDQGISPWLMSHLFLVKKGVGGFTHVPLEYIQKYGSARIQGDPRRFSEDIQRQLDDLDERNVLSSYYLWEKIADMLSLVAVYEDARERENPLSS